MRCSKPDDPSLIPRAHTVERKLVSTNRTQTGSRHSLTAMSVQPHAQAHTHKVKITFDYIMSSRLTYATYHTLSEKSEIVELYLGVCTCEPSTQESA